MAAPSGKSLLRQAGSAAATGLLVTEAAVRLSWPALAAVVFLAALALGAVCWVVGSRERSDNVARIISARRGDIRCLPPETDRPTPPQSR
jgi:hypothetical protein